MLVATDDERILEAVRGFGDVACLTSPDHLSGTDRLAEVAVELGSEIIVNVQGDEPLIEPAMIIVMAVLVGGLLFSILSAMFAITANIGR